MNRTVENVKATFTELGQIASISFDAVVRDDNGGQAAAPHTVRGPFPQLPEPQAGEDGEPGAPVVTEAELQLIAMELAEAMGGMFTHLESNVIAASTPVFVPPATPAVLPENEQRANMVAQVDNTISAVITRFTRFQMGYVEREAAAKAYKAAGYEGEVSPWISHFADNAGLDYTTATDRILAQADALRAAQFKLDAEQRMRKYKIMSLPTIEEARAEFADIMAEVSRIEASLQ